MPMCIALRSAMTRLVAIGFTRVTLGSARSPASYGPATQNLEASPAGKCRKSFLNRSRLLSEHGSRGHCLVLPAIRQSYARLAAWMTRGRLPGPSRLPTPARVATPPRIPDKARRPAPPRP